MQKSSNFGSFFKSDVFSCAFSTLPFSIFSPLLFALNSSLTARSGRHTTFACTLFLCRKCLKFPSTLQSMRFDSSGCPNFHAYRFVENAPFGFWILACMVFHATVQPMGVDSSGAPNFGTYPSLETILWGFCNTILNPCSQKLLFFLPSIRKLSWALAGNFLTWQLQGQISKFWPAARKDYFSIWDSFANSLFLGLATFGQDFKVRTSSLK